MDPLVRDALEVLLVIAIGGILWSAIGRMRRGEVSVARCGSCGHTVSRAYQDCPHCDAPLSS
jgi:rubrerythrin